MYAHRSSQKVEAIPINIGWYNSENDISGDIYIQPTTFDEFTRENWCPVHARKHGFSFEELEAKGLHVISAAVFLAELRGKEVLIDSIHIKYSIRKIQWQVGTGVNFNFRHIKQITSDHGFDCYEAAMETRRLPHAASKTARMMAAVYDSIDVNKYTENTIASIH